MRRQATLMGHLRVSDGVSETEPSLQREGCAAKVCMA